MRSRARKASLSLPRQGSRSALPSSWSRRNSARPTRRSGRSRARCRTTRSSVPCSPRSASGNRGVHAMWKTVLIYGLALAAGALGLQWLEYQMWARFHPLEVYLALVAVAFLALGVWVGAKLFRGNAKGAPFEPNERARAALGITEREFDVLRHLATGRS